MRFLGSSAPGQINQVILNLLLNAQQAIEGTGRDGGRIEIATRANRREVVLEITDNGCGIPQEIHSRIFDAFFTTKPVGEGTGLGLSISQSIVSDHGGRIELESATGQGALFRVILPVEGKGASTPEDAFHRNIAPAMINAAYHQNRGRE